MAQKLTRYTYLVVVSHDRNVGLLVKIFQRRFWRIWQIEPWVDLQNVNEQISENILLRQRRHQPAPVEIFDQIFHRRFGKIWKFNLADSVVVADAEEGVLDEVAVGGNDQLVALHYSIIADKLLVSLSLNLFLRHWKWGKVSSRCLKAQLQGLAPILTRKY